MHQLFVIPVLFASQALQASEPVPIGSTEELRTALSRPDAGAILKGAPNKELLEAIRKVAAGERILSQKIEEFIRESPVTPEFTKRQAEMPTNQSTPRRISPADRNRDPFTLRRSTSPA